MKIDKIKIFDEKFKDNKSKFVFQCILATLTILAVLLFLDILTEIAIITSLGASTMIAFTMPHKYTAASRRIIGGYIVGTVTGLVFYYLTFFVPTELDIIVFAAIAVGFSIFIMTMINVEHAPAAGVALGLVIQNWNHMTIIYIVAAVLWMVIVKTLLRNWMIDLT
ncbi:MAG: HPP family protein [Candidatus Thermoplasmatota archaeon]